MKLVKLLLLLALLCGCTPALTEREQALRETAQALDQEALDSLGIHVRSFGLLMLATSKTLTPDGLDAYDGLVLSGNLDGLIAAELVQAELITATPLVRSPEGIDEQFDATLVRLTDTGERLVRSLEVVGGQSVQEPATSEFDAVVHAMNETSVGTLHLNLWELVQFLLQGSVIHMAATAEEVAHDSNISGLISAGYLRVQENSETTASEQTWTRLQLTADGEFLREAYWNEPQTEQPEFMCGIR